MSSRCFITDLHAALSSFVTVDDSSLNPPAAEEEEEEEEDEEMLKSKLSESSPDCSNFFEDIARKLGKKIF
jgi:hypothetical protein